VLVGVAVGVCVAVAVLVAVGVRVAVAVGVIVAVAVAVAVVVAVAVAVGVGTGIAPQSEHDTIRLASGVAGAIMAIEWFGPTVCAVAVKLNPVLAPEVPDVIVTEPTGESSTSIANVWFPVPATFALQTLENAAPLALKFAGKFQISGAT
jgi:hypothetical protein